MYLKESYMDDPIFSGSKVVLSLYDDIPRESFTDSLKDTAADGTELAKLAIRYSDGIIMGSENIPEEAVRACSGLPVLEYDAKSIQDGSYIDEYDKFYSQI